MHVLTTAVPAPYVPLARVPMLFLFWSTSLCVTPVFFQNFEAGIADAIDSFKILKIPNFNFVWILDSG